ncbi:MXAN_6640 family putative metalloprotease [Nocardioides pocheonensis]|uniref:Peptidase n=1 Tax=Nocardioides pocheonensis TaxID=661485 RepID=A0A3N0GST8_9ACTN|nr:MXAN_6640 family putative metalloprotease [Nocardioides pocheonensis]RNM15238.1 hypothetical protein EFL26_08520 [Nocardioides pocheonensis]
MRSPLRAGAVAGVAIALVLSLPSLTAAQPSSGHDGRHRLARAQARALLADVRAALVPGSPGRRVASRRTDLTMELRDLRLALPALSPAERASATALLGTFPPPSSTCGGLLSGGVIRTTHFCVHDGSADPAWATTTAETLEHVWSVEVDTLHFRPPVADGDGLFDVYLQNLSPGLYGACAPAQDSAHSTASCLLDDDFDPAEFHGAPAINSLEVTAAHEFFHAIQFAYDTTEDTWFMEGTAVWAEEQVYGEVNDYVQYLPFSAITHPLTPVDYKGVDGSDLYYRYGAVLFWKFLSGAFGDPGIVRRVWEYADGPAYSLQAVTSALAERGWSFPAAFARFGVWNTLPAGSYDDAGLYPGPTWWQVVGLGRHARDTGTRAVTLDHLTNAAMLVVPTGRLPRRTRLRILVDGPPPARMAHATVQLRRRDGAVQVLDVPLDGRGHGTIRFRFDPRRLSSVVVTLTNASTRMATCGTDPADRYSCAGLSADDGLAFSVRAKLRLPRRR